jgi:hypothetical protein
MARMNIDSKLPSSLTSHEANFILLERILAVLEEQTDILREQAGKDAVDRARPVARAEKKPGKEGGRRWFFGPKK